MHLHKVGNWSIFPLYPVYGLFLPDADLPVDPDYDDANMELDDIDFEFVSAADVVDPGNG